MYTFMYTNRSLLKVKGVKCTLVQALRPCTGCTARRWSRGIALLFLHHATRRGWGVSVTPRPLFTPGKDPVPIVQEAGWAPGPVWTGEENLASKGIRSRTVQPLASRNTDYATGPLSVEGETRNVTMCAWQDRLVLTPVFFGLWCCHPWWWWWQPPPKRRGI